MEQAQHIHTDGTVSNVAPRNGKVFSLPELQWFVGGDIEFVLLSETRMMLVNKAVINRKLNPVATAVAQNSLKTDQLRIEGDVLVCSVNQLGKEE